MSSKPVRTITMTRGKYFRLIAAFVIGGAGIALELTVLLSGAADETVRGLIGTGTLLLFVFFALLIVDFVLTRRHPIVHSESNADQP